VISLPASLQAWGTERFDDTFKAEVEQLPAAALPLQKGLSLSSYVSDEPFRVMVIRRQEDTSALHIKAGIFYSGIIAGCSCSDDPSPTDVQAEYCDLEFVIDRVTAEVEVRLLAE